MGLADPNLTLKKRCLPLNNTCKSALRVVAVTLIERGLNLGDIMQVAAEEYSGRGGGHDVAAGAQIPIKNVEAFIKLVNDLVKRQLAGEQIGG